MEVRNQVNGKVEFQSLNTTTKGVFIALAVGSVAGIIILALGASHALTPKGVGVIATIAAGGTLTIACGSGLIAIAIKSCKKQQSTPVTPSEPQGAPVKPPEPIKKHYSEAGSQAIAYARALLAEQPDIEPAAHLRQVNGISNEEIAKLSALYREKLCALDAALEQPDPWSQQKTLDTMDSCMQLSFAIGCLTLEDLSAFTERLKGTEQERDDVRALVAQDSYQYRTFFYCPQMYNFARRLAVIQQNHYYHRECAERGIYQDCKRADMPEIPLTQRGVSLADHMAALRAAGISIDEAFYQRGFAQGRLIPEAHTALFYQEGSIQFKWRALYNEYCDQVRAYVDREALRKADNRHFEWTIKEEKPEDLSYRPTTLPT